MKQIRKNVFETNSSSVHSLAVPSKLPKNKTLRKALRWRDEINLKNFGWEIEIADNFDYLYTFLIKYAGYEKDEEVKKYTKYLNIFKEICIHAKRGIEFETLEQYRTLNDDEFGPYIDHSEELVPFVDGLFEDTQNRINFLVDGHILTGTDNCGDDEEYLRNCFEKRYKKKKYTVYRKGN